MHEEQNYGRPQPGDTPAGPAGGDSFGDAMSPQDERTWSVLAHLSVLAGLAGLMPLGALIIWLFCKDRSARVGFHALQALWFQVAWLVILVIGWFITFLLSLVLIGLLLLPVMLVASLVPFVHGCYAAHRVSRARTTATPL